MTRTWVLLAATVACSADHTPDEVASAPRSSSAKATPAPTPPADDMVAIPAGRFYARLTRCVNDSIEERPADPKSDLVRGTRVDGAAFRIDRATVTCAEFQSCVEAGHCSPAEKGCRRGIAVVPWAQATQYCAWRGGQLPSYAEWQRAMRGTDGRPFPMGFTWDGSCFGTHLDGSNIVPEHPDRDGCQYTSPDLVTFKLGSEASVEWTRTRDCHFGNDRPRELLPVAVDLSGSRLNEIEIADVGAFRCAHSPK